MQAVAAAAVGEGPSARRVLAEVERTPLRAAAAVESEVRLHVLDALLMAPSEAEPGTR